MGTPPSKDQFIIIRQNQNQVLKEADKLVNQLQLYNNEEERRQQRHLFARIILYGHGHLITHLKNSNQSKVNNICVLKSLDYETTDLLYQDLVLKNIKNEKKKVHYQKFDGFVDKNQQSLKKNQKFQSVCALGDQKLKDGAVAILLFVGGTSSRFKDRDNNMIPKQFYIEKEGQKCLLQIVLDKIQEKVQIYEKLALYLACTRQNHQKVKKILQKYPTLKFQIANQNYIPIVSLSGKLCVKDQKTFQVISSPQGCGDLQNLMIKGKKIFQQIPERIKYVCTFGVQNVCIEVADPYQIGILAQNNSLSVAYKCTYPDNQNQNLKRLVYNKDKKCLQAIQLQTLLQNAQKSCHHAIHQSQVWINSTVFKLARLQAYMTKKRQNLKIQQVFRAKKIQYSLWNPTTSNYQLMQHCFMFQRQLPDLMLNQELKSVGIMVERETQFAPVISISDQKTWADAYSQYLYKLHNKKLRIQKPLNIMSKVDQPPSQP